MISSNAAFEGAQIMTLAEGFANRIIDSIDWIV